MSLRKQLCKQRPFHHPSSLRGSAENEINVDTVNRCCTPEAISLHQSSGESLSKAKPTNNRKVEITRGCNPLEPQQGVRFRKPLHSKVRARRLPRRSSTSNISSGLVNFYLNFKMLLAMTDEDSIGCHDVVTSNTAIT